MWNKLKNLFRKKDSVSGIEPGCNLTIREAMILTGATREILYPKLEKMMDKAKAAFFGEGE